MMKRNTYHMAILILGSVVVFHAHAKPPALIHYQGRLVDGTSLVNGTVEMELSLYDAASDGTLLYTDLNPAVTVIDGLYDTHIGDNTTFGDLATAVESPQVWLQVVIDGTSLSPRERLVSVPYALHALYARDAVNLDGEAADAFMRRTGPESLTANSTTAALTVEQTGTSSGLEASTLSTAEGRAAVKGVAGDSAFSANSPAGVFGTSASYRGVVGSSSTSDGMLGFSQSGIGVHGQSLSGPGVRGFSSTGSGVRGVSSSGLAIEAIGDAAVTGDLNVNGQLDVGANASVTGDLTVNGSIQNSMMPIAMAWIWEDTTIYATSGNVTVIWNATFNWYEVTIAGENYNWTGYVTIVSPATAGRTYRILSGGAPGHMVVQFTDLSGNPAQSHFQFVTYKP